MIRAAGRMDSGRPFIILGLEEGNIDRLRKGQPIHIHADELGFAGELIVILGKDVTDLQKMCAPFIGARTAVADERGRKKQ